MQFSRNRLLNRCIHFSLHNFGWTTWLKFTKSTIKAEAAAARGSKWRSVFITFFWSKIWLERSAIKFHKNLCNNLFFSLSCFTCCLKEEVAWYKVKMCARLVVLWKLELKNTKKICANNIICIIVGEYGKTCILISNLHSTTILEENFGTIKPTILKTCQYILIFEPLHGGKHHQWWDQCCGKLIIVKCYIFFKNFLAQIFPNSQMSCKTHFLSNHPILYTPLLLLPM